MTLPLPPSTTPGGLAPGTPPKKRPAARIVDRKGKQGFASLDPAEQQRIARKGGKAAHASGLAHQWTPAEARDAGRKGGLKSRRGPTLLPELNPDALPH